MNYPKAIINLINEFAKLPTVGPKTAERYVFYLLKQPPENLQQFAQHLAELKEKSTICQICGAISEVSPCVICSSPTREKKSICVVERSQDVFALESTKCHQGLYHVLGGVIDTINNIGPEKLRIKELIKSIKNNQASEVILALNPNLEGETTCLYLTKLLKPGNIKISRLARGLPMGADLEYADEITLGNALKYRNYL